MGTLGDRATPPNQSTRRETNAKQRASFNGGVALRCVAMRTRWLALPCLVLSLHVFAQTRPPPADWKPSASYELLDLALEATARDIEHGLARPTVNSRELFLATAAMYDAWSAFDPKAMPSHGALTRQPAKARTDENKRRAMLTALGLVLRDLYPADRAWLDEQLKSRGWVETPVAGSPESVGAQAAKALLTARRHDGSNQFGDEPGGDGETPYADTTGYATVNTPEQVKDPDRWQTIPFTLDDGRVVRPGFLTPQWGKVTTYGLKSAAMFRPGPPPKFGTPQLKAEVDEVLAFNAGLTAEQKAIVEFMRDGPRSTGQSGHWLRFAQAVSRRDKNALDRDVKLYFAVAAACFDAFIAAWEAKRFYDSSRPWTLVRVIYAGKKVRGWLGPGKGVGEVPAEEWRPYSPASFVTPPFPGYVSGHSTVSGAASRTLELFTGSDVFEDEDARRAGTNTEKGASHAAMMSVDGKPAKGAESSCDVVLKLPTFSATAEMAGISRVMGGYHIQSDNTAGLKLGRQVADEDWKRTLRLFGK